MKKLMIVLLVVLMATFVFAIPAVAGSPVLVNGYTSDLDDFELFSVTSRGNSCHLDLQVTRKFEGTIEGLAPIRYKILLPHFCDDAPPDTYAHHWVAEGTFTGTVDGVYGTFDFHYVAQVEAGGALTGKYIIVKGSGGLASLRGVINEEGPLLGTDTYSGQLHFDP